MERPLITLTVFVSAILLSYLPLIVDSLGPDNSGSDLFPAPAATSSSSSSRPPPPKQAAAGQTGNDHRSHSPPPPPQTRSSHSHRRRRRHRRPRPHGKEKPKVNVGKKIGLLFAVIAGSLQVGVVLFLGIKRWQIMKVERHSS